MVKESRILFAVAALLFVAGMGASCSGGKKASGKPVVFVSIPPQKYIVDRIADGRVDTHVLIGAGQSPHTYTPTPKQIAKLSEANLYLTVGIPFEDAVLKKLRGQNRDLDITNMGKGVERATAMEHGHDAHHGHEELDAHIWLDPDNAVLMAHNTADALSTIDPDNREAYQKNKGALVDELTALDGKLAAMLAPFKGQAFFVYHPAFGYFAHAYGLEQVAVEIGGKEPTARALDTLIDRARADNVKVIFVQPQFSQKSADRVAQEIGGRVVPIDPLAEDYMKNMETMALAIQQALD